jgi:hypothetical protein
MSILDSSSEFAVRLAVEDFMQGALRSRVDGEIAFATRNSVYHFQNGVCVHSEEQLPSEPTAVRDATPCDARGRRYVGAELVGWLVESEAGSRVLPVWLRGARAVVVRRSCPDRIVVTSPTLTLAVRGREVGEGFATQLPRPPPPPRRGAVVRAITPALTMPVGLACGASASPSPTLPASGSKLPMRRAAP